MNNSENSLHTRMSSINNKQSHLNQQQRYDTFLSMRLL